MLAEARPALPDDFASIPPSPPPSSRVVDAAVTADQRTYVTFMHLMLVIATVTAVPMVLGPLVMWLIKRKDSPFIDDQGREALNFNLSILIYMIGAGLSFLCGIGVVLMPAVWAFGMACSVWAAIVANRGEYFRYPACIRMVA